MAFTSFNGMPVHTDITLTEMIEDWSRVRSPSRARRRRKMGHRQRIENVWVPKPDIYNCNGMLIMHPETLRKLVAKMEPRP